MSKLTQIRLWVKILVSFVRTRRHLLNKKNRHCGEVYGLDRLASLADSLGNFHKYLQFLPKGTVVEIIGDNNNYEESGEVYLFVSVKEPDIRTYWELIILRDEGNRKLKTYTKSDLPLPASELDHVTITVMPTSKLADVAFYPTNRTPDTAVRIQIPL